MDLEMNKKVVSIVFAILLLMFALVIGLIVSNNSQQKDAATSSWQEQYDLGVCYLSEGNYEEAIIAFIAAIEIDPKQIDAYISLVQSYSNLSDLEKAKEVLNLAANNIDNENRYSADCLSDGRYRLLKCTANGEKLHDLYYNEDGLLQEEFYYDNGRLVKECSFNGAWNPDIHEFTYDGCNVSIFISLTDDNGSVSGIFLYEMQSSENSVYLEGWGGDTEQGLITYLGVNEVTASQENVRMVILVDE